MKHAPRAYQRYFRQLMPVVIGVVMVGVFGFLGVRYYHYSKAATGGSLYISPAEATVAPDSTFLVTVREDSQLSPVSSVQFFLHYDSRQLRYMSYAEGDGFDFRGPVDVTQPGLIKVHRGVSAGGVIGDHSVLILRFKALARTGTANVSLDWPPYSFQSEDNRIITQAVAGGSYSIGTAAASVTNDTVHRASVRSSSIGVPMLVCLTLAGLVIVRFGVVRLARARAATDYRGYNGQIPKSLIDTSYLRDKPKIVASESAAHNKTTDGSAP